MSSEEIFFWRSQVMMMRSRICLAMPLQRDALRLQVWMKVMRLPP